MPESVGSHGDSKDVIFESVEYEDVLTILEQDGINIKEFSNFDERNFVGTLMSHR